MDTTRLDRILEKSFLPWWEWDVVENIVTFNALKVTMLGYDILDFVGKGYEAFTALIHQDDYTNAMESMHKVLRKETGLYQIDYRIKAKDGKYKWYMDRGYVKEKNENNDPIIIRGIVIDLGYETEKKEYVIALHSLLEKTYRMAITSTKSIITLCSNCKKVKNNENEWITVQPSLIELISEGISHGICPSCVKILYPEYSSEILNKKYQ